MMIDLGRHWKWKLRRTLYCSDFVYQAVLEEAERHLELYRGPQAVLDEVWADADRRQATWDKETGPTLRWCLSREERGTLTQQPA